ncbi:hypothetical protein ACFQE1_13405 [Halobium palmae]|uniref:Uncharacterized protein n=1 Tax=Halobium palmae TaxID=1776492 RepID=A0ABD5S175_9EURY
MDSDSPIASRTAGQPTLASGNGTLFTAMRAFKSEFGDFVGATDWLAPAVASRGVLGAGSEAVPERSHSYRRSAGGDGRYRRA